MLDKKLDVVIGLKVHVRLQTKAKLFSTAACGKSESPNTTANALEAGYPGVMPVVNQAAFEQALKICFALGSNVNKVSSFDRRNCFHPTLSSSYLSLQHYQPLANGGRVNIASSDSTDRYVDLELVRLEPTAGELKKVEGSYLVDLNTAGCPAIEIITKLSLTSAREAVSFIAKLRTILVNTEIFTDSKNISLTIDAILSVVHRNGAYCEVRALDSEKTLLKAITAEINRQDSLLKAGESLDKLVRRYNPETTGYSDLSDQETGKGYECMPDPDLPPLVINSCILRKLVN